MTLREVDILLDTPGERRYVVSAYADLRVTDGFTNHIDLHLRNQARAAGELLAGAEARKEIEANIDAIRQAVQTLGQPARGAAVFASVARGLRQVFPLDFAVENRLVIDEEPFLLPLLEHWVGEPSYLVALVDADEAHVFEAHHGVTEPVADLERQDARETFQRDKPRFTYKKRFARTWHERLHDAADDKFFGEAARAVGEHWRDGDFEGLVLLGRSVMTGALRRALPKEVEAAVVGEATHATTSQPDAIAPEVSRLIERHRAEKERAVLAELNERWKQKHLVANGPTEVLDALQQGRAVRVAFGRTRDLAGARCRDCGYRFGAPIQRCVYCGGECRTTSAAQAILQLAMRHRVPVSLLHCDPRNDPVAAAGGVTALLRAGADWAPGAAEPQAAVAH
jgi:hypothetical protein